jgi:hypothetical protein
LCDFEAGLIICRNDPRQNLIALLQALAGLTTEFAKRGVEYHATALTLQDNRSEQPSVMQIQQDLPNLGVADIDTDAG